MRGACAALWCAWLLLLGAGGGAFAVKVKKATKGAIEEDVWAVLDAHPSLLEGNTTAWNASGAELIAPTSEFWTGGPPRGIVVRAKVKGSPTSVFLHYRRMWSERRVRMVSDEASGGDRFVGAVPTWDLFPGDLVQWYVSAFGEPPEDDADRKPGTGKWYGAVVREQESRDPLSRLPALHLFVADVAAARTDNGTKATVAFDPGDGELRVYDRVHIRRRGSGRRAAVNRFNALATKDWAKRKFKLDFKGHVFVWDPRFPPVEEVNLHSIFMEPAANSYVREVLAEEFLREVGVPSADAFHVRVSVNNAFYGLFALVEQVDTTWLERRALPESSPLYKSVHWKYSNLRRPDRSLPCPWATPDWGYGWPGWHCPEVWRKANGAGGGDEDLQELAVAISERRRGGADAPDLFDRVDVFSVINEAAAQTLLLHADRCAKNYYMLRNNATGQWSRVAHDVEDSFATDSRVGAGVESCGGCKTDGTYCLLSCEWWNSIWFCDSDHPQDVFPESDGRSTFNHLTDLMFQEAATREMFLVRLRSLMDAYSASGWLEARAKALSDLVRHDAVLDNERWGAGDPEVGLQQLLQQLSIRKAQLYDDPWLANVPLSHSPAIKIRTADADHVVLVNPPTADPVDVSGWQLVVEREAGGETSTSVLHEFGGGTVVLAGAALHVVTRRPLAPAELDPMVALVQHMRIEGDVTPFAAAFLIRGSDGATVDFVRQWPPKVAAQGSAVESVRSTSRAAPSPE